MELLLTSTHQNKNLYVPWQWPTQSVFPVSEVVLSVPIHINSIFFSMGNGMSEYSVCQHNYSVLDTRG